MADRDGWSFNEVPARGKNGIRREYAITSLPDAARLVLAEAAAEAPIVAVSHPEPVPATADQPLKTSQIDAEIARDRIFKFVADFGGSEPRAIDYLNAGYHAETLPDALQWAMNNAWNKRRSDTRLTRDTLQKWKAIKKQRGRSAPLVRQKDMAVKPWHALAIALKQRPQGSCITWIHEQIEKNWNTTWGSTPPTYDIVRHFFAEKFSQIEQLKGRYTGSELSPHKRYNQRTSAGMLPWDELHADGWNTHFTAPHPVTGDYVTYEVWHAHDVATRYVPPLGIGLTENFEVIAKCIELAIRDGGCMAILQTDSTKIVKNSAKMKTDPATALAERVGFTIVHPVKVGNSQANGIAENWNVWLGREAKELATYQANDMDSLTFKRIKKITAKAVKAYKANEIEAYEAAIAEAARMGKGLVLQSYEQAVSWLESKRQKWNARPHSSLPKLRDPVSGKLRNMSPNEALEAARANGWSPDLFSEEYVVALFRPHTRVTVRRETVTPYPGMRYKNDEILGDWNGKEVVVAYDIMDWHQIWVKTLAGEPICIAEFDEATGYRAQSAYDAAKEKRANQQIKHRERQIETIRERNGLDVIDGESVRIPANQASLTQVDVAPRLSDADLAEVEARQNKEKPKDMLDLAMWLYGDQIDTDRRDPGKESAAG